MVTWWLSVVTTTRLRCTCDAARNAASAGNARETLTATASASSSPSVVAAPSPESPAPRHGTLQRARTTQLSASAVPILASTFVCRVVSCRVVSCRVVSCRRVACLACSFTGVVACRLAFTGDRFEESCSMAPLGQHEPLPLRSRLLVRGRDLCVASRFHGTPATR